MTQLPETNDNSALRFLTNRGTGVWALVLMAALLFPAIVALKETELSNDMRSWVPPDEPNALTLRWYHDHFPESETMLLSWEGSTLNDPRTQWLADRLQGVPDEEGVLHGGHTLVDEVITPQQLIKRITRSGDISHDEALTRLQGLLIGTGPLKLRLTELGQSRKDSVTRLLGQLGRDKLNVELESLEPVEVWEASGAEADLKIPERIVENEESVRPFPELPEHHLQVQWNGMRYDSETTDKVVELARGLTLKDGEPLVEDAFFAPGSPMTVAIVLSEAGVAEKRRAISEIRQVAAEVGISDDVIHLGGRPVANAAINQAIKDHGWNRDYPFWQLHQRSLMLFSGVVGIVLSFFMLRSVVLASLVLFVSYFSLLVTMAIVPVTGGSMNMVLAVMPTLMLVLTISGSIHVANYWRHAAKDNIGTAVETATLIAAKPCFLASLTTAFGLLSLTTSSLKPVAEFGLYAAIGCFVGLGAVLIAMPALLRYVPANNAKPSQLIHNPWPSVGRWISRHPASFATICLGAFLASSAGLMNSRTETKAIRYFPEHAQIVKDYRWMEANIGGIIPVDVVIRFGEKDRAPEENGLYFGERQEIVRRVQEKLVSSHPDITGAIALPTFRPTMNEEKLKQLRESFIPQRLDKTAELAVKEPDSPARSFVVETTEQTDLYAKGDAGLSHKGDELWRITAQVNIMTDVNYSRLTDDVDAIVREETRNVAGAKHVVTGMIPLFLHTQEAVLNSLIQSFALAFLVIAAVISYVLKSVKSGLLTMIPNILPISTVFGAISWFGLAIDIGTMITASVALGIAVDGTLHLLTWFRQEIRAGRTRRVAIERALGHCGPALFQTSVVVGTGMVVTAAADLLLISRFGWLMATMIGTALLADLVLLPALLAGWLGTLIMKTEQTLADRSETDSTSSNGDSESLSTKDTAGTAAATSPPDPHFLRAETESPDPGAKPRIGEATEPT